MRLPTDTISFSLCYEHAEQEFLEIISALEDLGSTEPFEEMYGMSFTYQNIVLSTHALMFYQPELGPIVVRIEEGGKARSHTIPIEEEELLKQIRIFMEKAFNNGKPQNLDN